MRDMDKWRNYLREWQRSNPDKVREYHTRYNEKHPNVANEMVKRRKRQIRHEVLCHYSGGKPHCACCNEDKLEFLCIDHINGCGTQGRKKTGVNLYSWLKQNYYPLGFRVLCHNCNSALGFYGYCPHSEVKHEHIVK